MKRHERLSRLRDVEREFIAAELAVECLQRLAGLNPTLLADRGLRPRNVRAFADNMEATYLIRLFAEFEATLRDVWKNGYKRRTEPPTRSLIDGVAARCGVPRPDLNAVHVVRHYRNSTVHEEAREEQRVEFADARSHLGKFLARLPLDW
jgi:hypothetical protein